MATLAEARQLYDDVIKEKSRRDIVFWAERHFRAEATVNSDAGLIQLLPHQRMILRYMFRRNEAGRFHYSTFIYSTVKKGGKTGVGAIVGQWGAETGEKRSHIYYVGNDANQAKERGYAALKGSVESHPDYIPAKGLLPGQWLIHETFARHLPSGSRVHAVATDYRGEAGSNPTMTIWTELWGFTQTAALKFWAEMAPSPTLPDSIRFIETYAGFVGESTLLEGLYESVVTNGRQLTNQDLIDALGDDYEPGAFAEATEPDSPIPLYVNEAAGIVAYWDSGVEARRMPWQQGPHGERYYQSEAATQTDSQFRRLHLNEWVSAESEFIPIELWDACLDPRPLVAEDRSPLVVALDAAVSGDCFGLVVVSRDPENRERVLCRLARKWEPGASGKIDFDGTEAVPGPGLTLQWLKDNFNIVQVCYDPYQLEYFAKIYRGKLGLWFEAFDQGARRLKSDQQLHTLIMHKRLSHDGGTSSDLRTHIQNCNAKTQKDEDGQLRLVKKSENKKIDLAVALSMASAEVLRLNI